jgi:formamidopyrimidine-DNA glycosylase
MPELPEVETLRRNLELTLVGRRFASVAITLPKVFVSFDTIERGEPAPGARPCGAQRRFAGGPDQLGPQALVGKRIELLRRRAKFLVFGLSEDLAMVFHLRLSGQLVHRSREGLALATGGHPVPAFGAPLPHKATHAIFVFDDGSVLYLTDIRQFGRVWLMPVAMLDEFLGRSQLGPEPLADDFTEDELRARLARRPRAALKPLLLDQAFLGGVGNIYADEIAFEARLSPLAPVGKLGPERPADLYRAIRSVLHHAVTNGVADIRNGRANPERDFPRVHGRADRPCPRCGATIAKTRIAGRGTYTCPGCQGYPPG